MIEVNNGKCLKLSSRRFIKTPLKRDDIGKISPRTYCDYTISRNCPDGGAFGASVLNSFPDVPKRVDFLNKFYQCLLFGQLPHKARKLVVCGENNSGKSSWARLFFGLLNPSRIASVTKEKTFGMSMIEDDTELIFIDEWSEATLDISNVKTLFQGGWMVKAVKNRNPEKVNNQAGMYLTCNVLPNFGDEQCNVDRRISVFHTKELKEPNIHAPRWIENHPMECLVWIISEINRNLKYVSQQERFYETPYDEEIIIKKISSFPIQEFERMCKTSIRNVNIDLKVCGESEKDHMQTAGN